jgi:meiotic recombination protein DMC1
MYARKGLADSQGTACTDTS